jgi:hypothetical protein
MLLLVTLGYHIEKMEYYNPGGSYAADTVIYPDGAFKQYKDEGLGALTIQQQWIEAWKHYKGRIK